MFQTDASFIIEDWFCCIHIHGKGCSGKNDVKLNSVYGTGLTTDGIWGTNTSNACAAHVLSEGLVVVGLLITAGNEGQNHDESEKQRKKLLHSSILPYFSGRRRAALRFILKCGCTSSDSIAKAKGRIKSDSPQFYFFCDN